LIFKFVLTKTVDTVSSHGEIRDLWAKIYILIDAMLAATGSKLVSEKCKGAPLF